MKHSARGYGPSVSAPAGPTPSQKLASRSQITCDLTMSVLVGMENRIPSGSESQTTGPTYDTVTEQAGQMRFVLLLVIAAPLLSGCASTGSNPIADVMLPAGAPPRPGTPAYDAWQAERAQEAARPKGKSAAQ